ncbi:ABC-2 type transport system permease protein [Marininema halotolerans]|uniref:ABC-2 type transport system permease protein n=2 Tax=Marininema halotolerans TaxID=1155944 RepID=A0A1I6P6M2_9BACL|nr:ABC-2 type transport system permease protein [Marininema halotolerans]
MNMKMALMYRANFFLNVLDSIVWFAITLLFFHTIFGQVTTIKGWDFNKLMLLIGTAELVKSMLFVLFIENLAGLPRMVNSGDIDGILLKPINSQFYVSLRRFDFGNFGNILPALFLIGYSCYQIGTPFLSFNTLVYVFLVLCSILLAYAIWFSVMTLSIWLQQIDGMHEFFLSAMTLMRFPQSIYKGIGRLLFVFLIPIVTITNVPVSILLNGVNINHLILFIVSTIFYVLFSIFFWKYSLRWYSSASS